MTFLSCSSESEGASGDGSWWYARWFERLLAELQIELWIGDAAEIRTLASAQSRRRDRQDAQLILKPYAEG